MLILVLTLVLAGLWTKLGMTLYAITPWLLVPYLGLGLIIAWFVQSEDEREATRAFWRRFI